MDGQKEDAKPTPGEGFELAAGMFEMIPVGVTVKGNVGVFKRTGLREFIMVDGEWNRWVAGFEEYLGKRGTRLLDKRPMPDEAKQAFTELGLEVHVSGDT